ncbi:seizure protein 6-like [Melanotaenia boesemani]|uniref:seizure protein 6-like n=1 Tax=Melanotaenia boesemani TaxID=1250792 RepID=UPI001C04312D|nr:seizure protein 6-like [Melanotaenia boesemani]XP_041851044.1 seizure protein 6-like [Melanotaenia boesemani]
MNERRAHLPILLILVEVMVGMSTEAAPSEDAPSITTVGTLVRGAKLFPTTQDSGRRPPVVTTISPINVPNHHPLYRNNRQHQTTPGPHGRFKYFVDSGISNMQPTYFIPPSEIPPEKHRKLSPASAESSSMEAATLSANSHFSSPVQVSNTVLRDSTSNPPIAAEQEESQPRTDEEEPSTTTIQSPVSCQINLTGPEGYIEAPPQSSSSFHSTVDCTYIITVYMGYGVEVQVMNVNLSESEKVVFEDMIHGENNMLANESILMKGLVLRSHSNQISIHVHSLRSQTRSLLLRYQAFVLSCIFPRRPLYGDVSVNSLHSGGKAFFSCRTGYRLQGSTVLTCCNASTPYWSGKKPHCLAACGGFIRNVTVGRIISPGFPNNYSNNLTCQWLLEAPEGQKLHIHFEKVALAEDDDRLLIKNGNSIIAPVLYDSYEVEYLPNEGLLSTSRNLFIEITTDASGTSTGIAIRYQAFAAGHCYEPFVKYGNLTSSDSTWAVGAVVEFSCDPGYTLEQGSVTIECMDLSSPQWNDTEPACRAVCSGEITDSAGVVLSPNWPEAYDKGQDCIWGIHVQEDRRIMLDIQELNIGKNDILTIYDGDDLTARVLGQYGGLKPHFKIYTSTADVTIQFQSDPATNIYGYGNGFIIHFFEVARNDTCPELPEIANGWKSSSQPELVQGTVVTYQCYPGYQLLGSELVMCQWDLTWSGDIPTCERAVSCSDPGKVENSTRVMSAPHFIVGSTIQYICNKRFRLSGNSLLTCFSRGSLGPRWNQKLPRCLPETFEPCSHPGTPSNATSSSNKLHFQVGETLHYSCHSGHQLLGDPVLHCVSGHPSQWSRLPPVCKVSSANFGMERVQVTVAVLIIILLILCTGVYLYYSKGQRKPLQFSLSSSSPYENIIGETMIDTSVYHGHTFETTITEETREYEVSI